MSCDVGKAREGLENELWRRWSDGKLGSFSKISITSPTSQLILILQAFRHFTYVTAHSPTLPSLYLRQSSFYNPSVASPTPQLILQPFFCFSYATGSSLTSRGEPRMVTRSVHRGTTATSTTSRIHFASLASSHYRHDCTVYLRCARIIIFLGHKLGEIREEMNE